MVTQRRRYSSQLQCHLMRYRIDLKDSSFTKRNEEYNKLWFPFERCRLHLRLQFVAFSCAQRVVVVIICYITKVATLTSVSLHCEI